LRPDAQALRSAAARTSPKATSAAELRILDGDPDRAGHRGLATAAKAKPLTAATTGLPRFSMRSSTSCPKAADCSASNPDRCASSLISAPAMKALVAGARQDDATDRRIIACILEGLAQVRPGRRVQRIEDLRSIDGDVAMLPLSRRTFASAGRASWESMSHLLLKGMRGEPRMAGEKPGGTAGPPPHTKRQAR